MQAEALTRDSLVAGHDALGFHVQAQGSGMGVGGLHHTADDLTRLFIEVLHLRRTFRLADALLDDLPRSLCGNTAKISGSGFNDGHVI